jgi:serine/threonine protein kinase
MTQPFDDDGLHALLERLLALPRMQRPAALADACAGNPALQQRIERLLALADGSEGFLDRSPFGEEAPAALHSAYAAGRTVGAYRLLRHLGAGGMAEVWLAERIEGGFRQQVAVKLIAHAPGRAGARFAAEREILAALAHPGIARLHDGGVAPDGLAWMAMEYVEGEHLTAWCQARGASLEQRLDLFLQVCDAVAYAHTRLVVHRDIKPANILVTADGQAKLLDFGIAKLLDDAAIADAGHATRTVQLSPSYAAPEQLGGRLVGTATDVYALGVTLFELLTGRLPWADEATPLATAMRRLADTEPPAPSRSVDADWPIPARALRGDLDAIVAHALRREPEQRYPDARTLAEDIRRHLEHRPVQARIGARGYVARRYLRRHWRGLALTAIVFLSMSTALVAIAWQARKARLEAQRAEAVQSFIVDLFRTNSSNQPDPVKARQTTARQLLDIGARRIDTQLNDAPENKLAMLRLFGDLYYDLGLLDESDRLRRQVLAISRRRYGEGSPEMIGDLITLARVNNAVSGRDEFAPQLAKALSLLDHKNDTQSFTRGRLLATAAALDNSKDPPRALAEARQAVAILDRFPESADLADALRLLGMIELYTGNTSAAVAPLRRAVELSIRTQGARGSQLSTYYFQLAQAEYVAMQFAAAEADLRKALAQVPNAEGSADGDRVRIETLAMEIRTKAERLRDAVESATKLKAEIAAMPGDTDRPATAYVMTAASEAEVLAGNPDAALADAEDGVRLYRIFDAGGVHLAAAMGRKTQALVELGKSPQARQALAELADFSRQVKNPRLDDLLATSKIRFALDEGRMEEARALFTALPPLSGDAPATAANAIRRSLVEAGIDLAEGDTANAARLADAAVARARASELAPYLSSAISDGELTAGLARVRGGDAAGAQPLLADALAIRTRLYLPQSPRIAEAQLALAEGALALGRRDEAAGLVAQAEAIEKQHSSLSARYREPLVQLRAALGKR